MTAIFGPYTVNICACIYWVFINRNEEIFDRNDDSSEAVALISGKKLEGYTTPYRDYVSILDTRNRTHRLDRYDLREPDRESVCESLLALIEQTIYISTY